MLAINNTFLPKPRIVPRLSARFAAEPFTPPPVEDIKRDVLLQNSKPDLVFLVQGQKILAHQYILSRRSKVFRAMLSSRFPEERVISITDATPRSFELFLKAVYEGPDVCVNQDALLCQDCFMIAHKYNIQKLELFLLNLVLKKTTAENAFDILTSPSIRLELLRNVKSKCWSLIEQNTLKAIESPTFLQITGKLLLEVVSNTRLSVSEFTLAKRCWEWCTGQKRNKKLPESLIDIFGLAIYQIRFPLMTPEEFKFVCKIGMLQDGERKDLIANFRNNSTFINVRRSNRCQCLKDKVKCPLCSTKKQFWTSNSPSLHPPRLSISEDLNDNHVRRRSRHVCECQKYVSCPAFPNGATFRVMRAKHLI